MSAISKLVGFRDCAYNQLAPARAINSAAEPIAFRLDILIYPFFLSPYD